MFVSSCHVDSVARGVNKSDDNFGDGYRLQDFASLAISHSIPAHYNGDLGPDTLLIIGVKGAIDRAARAALFHYLGPQSYLSVQRGGFQKLDAHCAASSR